MRDCFEIGSSPWGEKCAQVGSVDYAQRAKRECQAYKAELIAKYGEVDGCTLKTKSNPHDFGTYYEVAVYYDGDNKEHRDYAYNMERGVEYWTGIGTAILQGYNNDDIVRSEIMERIEDGDYDISDIFDGDLMDLF